MKKLLRLLVNVVICHFIMLSSPSARAQVPLAKTSRQEKDKISEKGLFDTDSILNIKLSGDSRKLLNDRGDNPGYHAMNLLYSNEDSIEISIPVKVKTRGHFRKLKENCNYPPLLLHFSKSEPLKSSIFNTQDKVKLVMPCIQEEYVIREWMVYRLYNLVTPKSFRSRLVRLKMDNTQKQKTTNAFYGILLEEEKQMAKRNGMIAINLKRHPTQTDQDAFLTMAVFQYLVGNTDWSVEFLQNIKLIAPDSNSIPATVAYDFDHSGMVSAPYAHPAEALLMSSVRERRYRGYCVTDMKKFDPIIALFNHLKKDIYGLYTNCTLLDKNYIKSTLKYFDEFYATINNASELKKEIGYPCNPNGTGNVVIKGLKED